MLTLGLAIWAGILLLCHATWGWVPILDSANLAFHEAGHPIFGMLSDRLMVYGGTFMQLIIPGTAAFEMHRQEKQAGFYFCLTWFAENLLNVARYMADARAHDLPLVGGRDPEEFHDWTRIFENWGVLSADTTIAGFVRILAFALIAWTLWQSWRQPQRDVLNR